MNPLMRMCVCLALMLLVTVEIDARGTSMGGSRGKMAEDQPDAPQQVDEEPPRARRFANFPQVDENDQPQKVEDEPDQPRSRRSAVPIKTADEPEPPKRVDPEDQDATRARRQVPEFPGPGGPGDMGMPQGPPGI